MKPTRPCSLTATPCEGIARATFATKISASPALSWQAPATRRGLLEACLEAPIARHEARGLIVRRPKQYCSKSIRSQMTCATPLWRSAGAVPIMRNAFKSGVKRDNHAGRPYPIDIKPVNVICPRRLMVQSRERRQISTPQRFIELQRAAEAAKRPIIAARNRHNKPAWRAPCCLAPNSATQCQLLASSAAAARPSRHSKHGGARALKLKSSHGGNIGGGSTSATYGDIERLCNRNSNRQCSGLTPSAVSSGGRRRTPNATRRIASRQ